MKTSTCVARYVILLYLLLITSINAFGQRIYASGQDHGSTGLLCVNCTVINPANAADGNTETYSRLNVVVGVASETYQELIFPGNAVAAGTPVTVKLGTGNNLVSATVLGGILLQAYNGTTAIGQPVAASTLVSALSNNDQIEVSITPTKAYDRIRVSLDGGLAGALSSLYLYEGFYNGNAAGACNSAIDELHGISAGLLNLGADVGGVLNPQNAIDGNLNTYAMLNAGVGLVGAYAQETVIYEAPSVRGDSIRLTLAIPDALIQAGILSNVSVSTYNGTNGTAETYTLTSSLLKVQLLGLLDNDNRKVVITFAPVNLFDRVQLTLGGIVGNVLSSLRFYEAQKLIPKPVIKFAGVITNNAFICHGSTAVLTAVAQPNTTFLWYTTATGGTPVFTGSSFTTPALTATTIYYVAAMRAGCTDQSERTAVTVTVNNTPANPVVTNATLTVCPGTQATFIASAVTGVTVNWYTAATGGTLVATGNTFTTGALTTTTNYYAEAVAGGTCVSPGRTPVTATVSALPASPTITTPNVTICDGDAAVFSITNPVLGVTYNWYSTATGGTALYTGINFTTPALHATTSYYVEADNSTSYPSSARTTVTATVSPKPADPVLTANNSTIAAGQTATINVTNSQTGLTYNWYTSATAAASFFTGTTFTTPALYTNTTYYVSAVNATGCQSAGRTAVTIYVTNNTTATCSLANRQTNSVNNICIGCSVTNAAQAVDADTTTASSINVLAGLVGGNAQQTLLFQQPGYAGDTIKLELGTPANLLTANVASSVQVTLLNGTTVVGTYALNNDLIKISLLAGTNRYAVLIPATGNYDRVRITVNSGVTGLLSSLQVYYAVQDYPKPIFNPANPEICKGSTAQINVRSPANGTFQWYTTPTGGTPVYTGISFTTPALNANTGYYIAYTRGTCVSNVRYPVQVLVDAPPVAPVVTPSTTTIYSGKTATFTATVANNVTVKWYTTATGSTPVYTGLIFTTPALTTATTYYAESSLGECVSPTRTPAQVNITPVVVPNVTVTPPTQTINMGTIATLVATSTTPGTTFNWYTTPTGGTSIYTGATFTTPPVFANTTYYAEAVVTASGTTSATRASGVVDVNASTVSPTPCDAAISQTNGTSGLVCVGCSVNNPSGAVDADRNTFSQLDVPVGLVGSYAVQTLQFANTAHAGDTVVVELGTPGSLANVSLLSQISLATYNGATYNNDRVSINSSLISITLLNGTTRFRYAFVAAKDFNAVEIRLNSGIAGVLSALNIYDASQEVAAPVIGTTSITACQGTQATITATVPSYETVRWYTTATGGTPVFTGSVFNTPALNATTTYYAEASRMADGCAQIVRTPATVTVTPVPAAPVVTAPTQKVCSGSPATFQATAVTGVTFSWYTAATGGTPVFTGNPFTTPALNTTTSYYVEANSASACSSSTRTQVTANVTTTPSVQVVSQTPVQTCSGSSAVLTATSPQAGVTFNWYNTATGGTSVYTGAQFTTPALTQNASYYVEAASGSCLSPNRAEADVTVNPTPIQPVVTVTPAGGQISSGQTATLNATSGTAGVTFNWYTTATGGTPIFTGPTYVTPALTSNTTYYVDAVLPATGCTSPQRTAITITVNPVFSTSCDFASSQSNSTSGICVGCSIDNPNNSVDMDTTNYAQLNLPLAALNSFVAQKLIFGDPGLMGDTVKIRLRIPASGLGVNVLSHIQITSYNGITSNNDGLTLDNTAIKIIVLSANQDVLVEFVPKAVYNAVQVSLVNNGLSLFNSLDILYATKQVEQPQLAASTVNICSGNTATFTVSNSRTGVTYTWYNLAVGGTLLYTGKTYTTANLSATTTFYVQSSRTATGCANPNRVAATANVTPSPVNPILAQAAVTICSGDNVILSVTNAGTATVNWYDAANGGNLLFSGANYQVTPIATTSYYAELTNGSCTSPSRTLATVTVNPRPSQPGVQSANVTVCNGSPATLVVIGPEAGVTYNWYTAATGGTTVFAGTSFTTPPITQSTTYYVEAANIATGCTNNGGRTAVNITVSGMVNAPALSATQTTVCNGGTATISVNNPVAGLTYNWYTAASGGSIIFTGTTYTTGNLIANTSYFVEADNSTGCASATLTETDITVLPIPTPPQLQTLSGNTSVCAGAAATISITNPDANDVYRWYDAATGGNLIFTGTEYTTPALTQSSSYYVEAATAGNCNASTRTAITIIINPTPADPTLVSSNVAVCTGNSATLSVSSPQTGVSYQWYDSPAENNLLFTGSTYITGPITNTTDFYVVAVNGSGCTSSNSAQAHVTIQAPPAAPVVANGNTVQSCSGSQVTLTIANPDASLTYNWFTASTGGASIFTGTSFTTPALTASTSYYVEAVNSTGCASSARTEVDIDINAIPTSPTVTAQGGSSSPTVCSGSPVTLTATSNTANVTFNWYAAATGGTPIFTGATYTTPALTAAATYYVEAVSNTGGCSSGTRTSVQVSVTQPPATPVPTNAAVSVCTGSLATLSVANPQTGLTYSWYDTATKNNLLFTGSTYTTGPINANNTFYVEAENGSCTSPSLASVTVTAVPAPSVPVVTNGNPVTTCMGSQVTLSIDNPQSGFTYNWYTAATGGTAVYTGTDFVTPVLGAGTTYYAEADNNTGCPSASRAAVNITVSTSPDAPVVSTPSTSVCPGTAATLTATVTDANTVIKWYAAATGGTALATGNSFTTPDLNDKTTYYAEAVNNTSSCTSATRTAVTVTIMQPLAAPVVSVASTTATSVTFQWDTVSGATGYQVSIDNGVTFTDPSSGSNGTTDVVAGIEPGVSITIVVRATGTTDCQLSGLSAAVKATAQNPLGDQIFVPNAFTPNGDGKNDIEYVYGTNITSLKFYVYDQWGELIYTSLNQVNGWDGTYKGTKQPVGVYVYFLEAIMNDGQHVKKKGTITLLR